jgi:hypothetical protein
MTQRRWGVVLVVVCLLKILVAAQLGASRSVGEIRAQAEAVLAGTDVLEPSNTGKNPSFFPGFNHVLAAGCLLLARALGVELAFALKLLAIVCDLGIGLLLLARSGAAASLAYTASPITIVLSVYHGQLHTTATAFAFAAIVLSERGRAAAAGVLLALATGVRQHFFALLPVLPHRLASVAGFALAFVVTSAPLLALAHAPQRLLAPAFDWGNWGWGLVLWHSPRALRIVGLSELAEGCQALVAALAPALPALALAWPLIFMVSQAWRPGPPQRAALVLGLGIYLATPAISVQWFVWVMPFLAVVSARLCAAFGALSGAYVLASYWLWSLSGNYETPLQVLGVRGVEVLGLSVWLFCAYLLLAIGTATPRPEGSPISSRK